MHGLEVFMALGLSLASPPPERSFNPLEPIGISFSRSKDLGALQRFRNRSLLTQLGLGIDLGVQSSTSLFRRSNHVWFLLKLMCCGRSLRPLVPKSVSSEYRVLGRRCDQLKDATGIEAAMRRQALGCEL